MKYTTNILRIFLWTIALLWITMGLAHSSELPDAPMVQGVERPAQHLWTKEFTTAFVLNAGLRTADAVMTCRNLAHGGHEDWLGTQSCAGTSAMILSAVPVQIAAVWMLQRTGHRKMARVVAWGIPAYDAVAITYSVGNGGTK